MSGPTTVAIVGSGAWGTTLALLAVRAGRPARLYVRDPELATQLTRHRRNSRFLPDIPLPPDLDISADLARVCAGTGVIVLAVPSQTMRDNIRAVLPHAGDAILVSAAKGLERGSLKRMTEVIAEEAGPGRRICALSGPNLAREIAAGKPATTVIASADLQAAERIQELLISSQFRAYTNEDVVGVEMGGALKNIIAIGAGMADGLDAGDNAKAAFLTRGIAEIARLGIACGAEPLTFAGLAGLGDLVATCASPLSRNNSVGRELANGRSLPDILGGMSQVAEGVATTEAAFALGQRLDVELPITEQMHAVLFAGKAPLLAVAELMHREPKHELAGLRALRPPESSR